MTATSPLLTLNNGVEMPAIGLGVYQSTPTETGAAVEAALATGYRLIDTAAAYGNEREVGDAIRAAALDRSAIFVETKLWISDYGYDEALVGCDASLRRLGLDHVDLYLLHQPMPNEFERTIAAYKGAERLLADGKARAIGVSNFSSQQLTDLIASTDVVPAVNQVELHPYYTQRTLREMHAAHGIVTQSWSPIGGVNVYRPNDPDDVKNPLEEEIVARIAEAHGKTPAQVILRWQLQHGFAPIPKSVRPRRIAENFDLFGFTLSNEEIAAIDALDTGVRGGPDPEKIDTTTFPFAVDNS